MFYVVNFAFQKFVQFLTNIQMGEKGIIYNYCGLNGSPEGNRTPDTAVKGRCLNRLTNGPNVVAAVRFELTTYRV